MTIVTVSILSTEDIDGMNAIFKKAYDRNYDVKKLQLRLDVQFDNGQAPGNCSDDYSMTSHPHGFAVIINNTNFCGNLKTREGSEIDEENLSETFRFLGYDVLIYQDCSAQQMQDIFKMIVREKKIVLDAHDSFVCCILSHGSNGKIVASDSEPVDLKVITSTLQSCKELCGKPKMFFIQACRGTDQDTALEEDQLVRDPWSIPIEADFLFSYATPLGYVAYRHIEKGSPYIRALCKTFCKNAKHATLVEMHTTINRKVSVSELEGTDRKQIPELQHRLCGNIHFFPKM